MRALALVALLACAGCASSSHTTATSEPPAVAARADSLLAVHPDSLGASDRAWLAAYAARRTENPRDQRTTRVLAVMGGLGAFVLLYLLIGGTF